MKLRITGNSIRLRLMKSEVAQLAETGLVEETIEFGLTPDQRLTYALSLSESIEIPCAEMKSNRLSIILPAPQAETWRQTDQIGIRAGQILSADKKLQILVEKDFACLEERPGEDESDAFPHPKTGQSC